MKFDESWLTADERNVHICLKWDNQRLYEDTDKHPSPIYTNWRVTEPTDNKEISEAWLKKILDDQTHEAFKPRMQMIISGVQQNDLLKVNIFSLYSWKYICNKIKCNIKPYYVEFFV